MINNKFSVVIPCYNADKYISSAIESIHSQSESIEIIIVDDGSTDQTKEIVSNYNVKYIYKLNGGVSSARNVGIDASTGDYILFLDADDIYKKGLFKKLDNIIDEYQGDLDFISWGFDIDKYGDKKLKVSKKIKGYSSSKDFLKSFLKKEIYQSICTICIKKEIVNNSKVKFNEKYKYGEDYEFQIRIMNSSSNCYYIDDVFFSYIFRHSSAMGNITLDNRLDVYKLYSLLKCDIKDDEILKCFDLFLSMYQVNDLMTACYNKDKKALIAISELNYIYNAPYSFDNIKCSISSLVKIFYLPFQFLIKKCFL
ncbi:TPA: glycosyltransferase family 2 protein [Photobacterium damselae]